MYITDFSNAMSKGDKQTAVELIVHTNHCRGKLSQCVDFTKEAGNPSLRYLVAGLEYG